jgi:3-hydroxybutyryl-CoA dehydrogenase
MSIQSVGIVGAGQMGSGIAEVCARAGLDVVLVDISAELAAAGKARIEGSLARAVEREKATEKERREALKRLILGTSLDLVAGCDLVVEAVVEDVRVKTEVFRRLDEIVESPGAILASNTSSIPIIKLARATGRPASVIGLHFFNPVPVMNLVEIVPSLETSEETIERCRAFVTEALGKEVIRATDRAGFIVNALLIPYLVSAIRMYEGGFATKEDIDRGMELGTGHPMGPLALCDLIGNDTVLAIADVLYDEYKDPVLAPPPLLRRMVGGGLLGRKSGRGFYEY